ncbi:MAG: PIN domain-containing protein [Candidatus Shapirobacteria bacterium]|jgi:predicted nucleic acid-binding protein
MEKNKILVDSCVWIAFYDVNDRQHDKAVDIFQKLQKKNDRPLIHLLVLIETLSILKYKRILKNDLKKIKISMLNNKIFGFINETKLDFDGKVFDNLYKDNKMGLVDLILLDYCKKNKVDLVTLDKAMNEEWRKLKAKN